MRKLTLTILLVVAVAATWAQKPDKKTVKLEKQLVGSFVEVPAGHYSIIIGKDTTWVTFAAFRMLATEVSNASYNLFLDDLKAQGRMADYEKAKIDILPMADRENRGRHLGIHPSLGRAVEIRRPWREFSTSFLYIFNGFPLSHQS